MRWTRAVLLLLIAAAAAASVRAGPHESIFTQHLKEALGAAVEADGGKAWTAAVAEVKEYPPPSNPGLAKGEHGRAVALVVKTINALASEGRRAHGKIVRTMDAAHAAYERSKGKLGKSLSA